METKHTKGSWKVYSQTLIRDENDNPIASAHFANCQNGMEEAEANAKLIALAPDMLSILNHICNRLGVCSLHDKDMFREYYNRAQEIIKKATE